MTMTLYYAPGACSFAAHAVLHTIGAPFTAVRLNLMEGDQRKPDFLALNPKGRVPALVTEAGVLTESPAILQFLVDSAPAHGLLPSDPWARAQAISFLAWCSGTVHGVGFASVFRQARFASDEAAHAAIRATGLDSVRGYLTEIDERLSGRAFVFDQFGVADLYPMIFRRWAARVGIAMDAYPSLLAHADRVAAQAGVAKAIAAEGIALDR